MKRSVEDSRRAPSAPTTGGTIRSAGQNQPETGGDEEEEPRERQRVEELFPQIRHAGRLDRSATRIPRYDTSASPSRRDRSPGSWGWGADTWDPSPPPPRSRAAPPGDRTCA